MNPAPRWAERLMRLSLPPGDRAAVMGDLFEEFGERCARDGVPQARRWYRRQVRSSLGINLRSRVWPGADEAGAAHGPGVSGGIMQDLRYAIRSFRGAPGFTIAALTILTLGIGASTAIFSVVDAVVLRALPFDEHDRLVAVGQRRPLGPSADSSRDPLQLSSASPQNYMDWVAQQDVFESIAAYSGASVTLQDAGQEPEDLRVLRTTAGFFDVLRVRPSLGRAYTAEHEVDGRHQVVVLSDGLWRRRFGADPGILGRPIPFNGLNYEVIGVMPPGFTYPVGAVRATDLWAPYVVPASERTRIAGEHDNYLQTIARLEPGVSVEGAQARMDQISAALIAAYPAWNADTVAGVRPLRDHIVAARTKSWLMLLLGAVGMVLLIACANVANLLMARASGRERELKIRTALGAGRWRLVRQLLLESVLLAGVALVLSLTLAGWAVDVLRASMPDNVARVSRIALDLRVLAAAAGISLATAMLFGLFPALQASRPARSGALNDGARGNAAGGRQYLRHMLVVVEVALAVVLLVGAALFAGSFLSVMRVDPGFDPANVLTVNIAPAGVPGLPAPDARGAYEQIVEELSATPGVRAASVVLGGMPLGSAMWSTSITSPEATARVSVSIRSVTPGYHRTLGIPLKAGRLLGDQDRAGSVAVTVLNESAARSLFPTGTAVGRAIVRGQTSLTVVGIVGDIHQSSLEEAQVEEMYVPMAQSPPRSGELLVRTAGDPLAMVPALSAIVHRALPDVPLRNVRSLEQVLERQVAQRRLNMLLIGAFGVLGLVISAVGVYGVMAYVVAQRTKEIGVRMALGATRGEIVSMVMRGAAAMVGLGLVLGGVGAWFLSASATSFLFQVEATDPRAFLAAVAVLVAAAFLASAVPARRAAGVDPMRALRLE